MGCKQEVEVPIDYTAPAEVTELRAEIANGTIILTWTNPSDKDFNGVQIEMSPAEGILANPIILGKGVTSFSLPVSGLSIGKKYIFILKTLDKSSNYSKGELVSVVVPDTTVPADVTELKAINKDASVILTWVDSTDEDIIGYEVTYKKTSLLNRLFVVTEDSNIVPPGSKGCYISNLTNGTEYQFTVKSVDRAGNKSQGVTTTFTPTSIEKTPLQITLEPSTTEKTNQDVVITVKATTDTANEIKKIAYINETVTNIDDVLLGTNITETKEIIATENGTYSVAVTDTAGGQELAFITVSNIDKTAPSQVTNTEVTYFGALNKFMLSWTNPSDEDFAGIVITYGKKDSEETTTIELSNDITSYEIENIPDDDSEYTISLKTKDDVENFGEAEIVTLVASKRATIFGVTIPNAGEGYTGELPVTIIGENLIGNFITCNDETFTNITYLSDTKATATITCSGVVGESTITVTSGASSVNCTLKVVESEKCFSVGDILFTDGTRIKAEKLQYGIPDSQISKAFAVIASAPYGGGTVGKAVGLQRSSNYLQWAPYDTTGYSTNFTGIQAIRSGDSSSGYTFSGDIDGSDNWEYICSIDPEGTKDAATNYPAFNFALIYGTRAGLTGTDYENGWYVPSVAELYDVYTNKEVVQTSLNAVGGFELGTSDYWSSSQNASSSYSAYRVDFADGSVENYYSKTNDNYVFVLQAFNVEQFNNYEYGTPSITSVTVANAGEGYTGELPVTIIGENLKGHAITSNDASFGNVNYVSDNMIKATVNCNGIVGENTITVTSGASSANCTVKVVESEKCFSVGDVLFTDGTKIKAENVQYGVPDSQISKAFAVIASVSCGGGVGKAVGLQKSSSALEWAPEDTTGYNTNFTKIQADFSGDSSSGYTFSGDIDGSDNWEYICSIDPEGTKDLANNYPAFNFALTYGTTAGLTGTEYENGWYVPSVAELYDVYTNKEVVQTSLNAAGVFTLGTGYYWSSSQAAFFYKYAYQVSFYGEGVCSAFKDGRYVNYYVLVLQAFNVEQFNDYSSSSNITSVTIANAGEGYTGELPVTIIGENLKGNAITSNDSSFGNVTYISDTKATATITCSGVVGESTITVTSGASSANCKVKVVAAEKCFSVGEVLFTDGTRMKAENVQYGIPDSQLNKAFAVITSVSYEGGVGKAVGLQKSASELVWAPSGTTGYITNFTGIQADYSGDSSSGYTFSGDIDGSDNWESICKVDPEGTQDAATNYPAFNFALTYGTQAGLTETEYENGWYVPSVAELYNVYTNKEVVQTSLNAAGGFALGTSMYWSSSQEASGKICAYFVRFSSGEVEDNSKSLSNYVFVLQAFNVEQFNVLDITPPGDVSNVVAKYSASDNTISVSWTNPTDEDFAGIVITYGKKDSEETTTIELSNDITSYEIENIPYDDSEYTISLKTKDDVENFGEAKIVTLVASKRATISSVTIPNAGEGYTGELPVTITGTNLKDNEIICSDSSFGNVTYISDTKVTATFVYNGTNNIITVTSGASSASGTVKVVAAEKCFSVGEVLFTDGTRMKAEKLQYGIPDSQLDKAFAVIASISYGGGVGKAVGLQKSASTLMWASSDTTGYYTNFTGIQGTRTSGDMNGSDNWEYICSIAPVSTKDPANDYPAFNFALTYGTQAGLTGTEYENGWYVPSVAELYDVYTNKEVVQTSLNAAGGFTLGTGRYWSSSQSASSRSAYYVYFYNGNVDYYGKDNDDGVFVLQAFNAEQFNNYEVTTIPSITSVTIPHAGEGYTGELPVTIIGENLKGYVITCSDLSFGNVTYISDTKATATIHYDGSNNTITVTSGISSASGTVKVVAAENCFSVGDILFTDGTRIKAKNVKYGIPDSQLSKAFAVITSVSYGGGVGKAVGLQKSASELVWAPSGTRGYSTNFTRIQADYSGDSSSGYTFSGDIDGSDNWEHICSIDPEGTKDAATNYPAFNFALTYGTQAGLTGTEYETGWYVPSVAELYDVYTMYTNKKVVQKSLNAAGGFTLGTSYYWSSSQSDSSSSIAYFVNFDDGSVGGPSKYGNYNVFVLQAFNAEQFNNYEVTTIPSITSVTVANAGEGYTGKLLVTIIGENLKGHAITSNDASFGNVTNLSDTKATATITCSGVVGESTITVTSGTSSATGTVKVVAAEKCYSVGDILFTDGTRMKAENVQYGLPSGKNAFAVIASAPYGGGVGKAVGLQKSAGTLMWAPSGTTGYSTKFTEIQVTPSYSTSSGYTFSGDIDGSDNWEYICSIDPEGTKDPANNYPAFNFALIYGTQAGLTETEYENGWYVPSVAELYDVYTNKEDVQTSLNAVGGFTLGGHYWSSSQVADASGDNHAIEMYFDDDVLIGIIKNYYINVFVLQAFNAGQFN